MVIRVRAPDDVKLPKGYLDAAYNYGKRLNAPKVILEFFQDAWKSIWYIYVLDSEGAVIAHIEEDPDAREGWAEICFF